VSINSIQAIKEAEALKASVVDQAKEKAAKTANEKKAESQRINEEQLQEARKKREAMLEEARDRAAGQCAKLELENQTNKKSYQEPGMSSMQKAIEAIKVRILNNGS
jgi:vacuolar-type H+-ATPase subunit H